jgi:hypothetical protein
MHRYLIRAALVALGGAIVVTSAGCGTTRPDRAPSATSTPTGGTAGLGSAAPDGTAGRPGPSGSPAGQGGQPDGGNTGGGSDGGGDSGGTTDKKAGGPTIVHYRIKQKPQCDQGTNVNRVPGLPVVLEWRVTGADRVTISVDGPGVYDTYPATGTATINFPCGGDPGQQVTHTYLLRTVGGGEVRTRTLTASALVNEIPSV